MIISFFSQFCDYFILFKLTFLYKIIKLYLYNSDTNNGTHPTKICMTLLPSWRFTFLYLFVFFSFMSMFNPEPLDNQKTLEKFLIFQKIIFISLKLNKLFYLFNILLKLAIQNYKNYFKNNNNDEFILSILFFSSKWVLIVIRFWVIAF